MAIVECIIVIANHAMLPGMLPKKKPAIAGGPFQYRIGVCDQLIWS